MYAAAVGEYSSETKDFAHMTYDPRFAVFVDTSVAVQPSSHSLRFNLPSGKPQLIDFPGPPQTECFSLVVFTLFIVSVPCCIDSEAQLGFGPHDRHAACPAWALRQTSGMGSRTKPTNKSWRQSSWQLCNSSWRWSVQGVAAAAGQPMRHNDQSHERLLGGAFIQDTHTPCPQH